MSKRTVLQQKVNTAKQALRSEGFRLDKPPPEDHYLYDYWKSANDAIAELSRFDRPTPKKRKAKNRQARKHRKWKNDPDKFYDSQEWREIRYKALRKHAATCCCCGARASDGVRIHVDHIKPRSKYPRLELDIDNLQVLCEDCNFGKSNYYNDDWRVKMQCNDDDYWGEQ